MIKKYEIIKADSLLIGTHILYRIKALRDFSGVKAGDLGGYIKSEENLCHNGTAWVGGNAWVSGNARVYGNAQVYGGAWVYGSAQVSGNAKVYGNAQVCGMAQVCGDAWVCGDARVRGEAEIKQERDCQIFTGVGRNIGTLTAYRTKGGSVELTRDCFRGTIGEFRKASEKSHADNPKIKQHYELLLQAIELWFGEGDAA
jgi:hypothetical protein